MRQYWSRQLLDLIFSFILYIRISVYFFYLYIYLIPDQIN